MNTTNNGARAGGTTPKQTVRRTVAGAVLAAVLLGSAACSTTRDASEFFVPGDAGTLVVDGMLLVGQPFSRIVVSRVLPAGAVYSADAAAERGATVNVISTTTGVTVRYLESTVPGTYLPLDATGLTVMPEQEYQLSVTTSGGTTVTSRTTTPAAFQIDSWLLLEAVALTVRRELETFESAGDSVYTQPANQLVYADGLLEARFSRPAVEGFQVGISSLDLDSDFVIEPEFFSQEDFDNIKRDGSSPPLEAVDGTARLPWFAIFFEGRYKIRILALDHNSFDYVRSIARADGGFSFGGSPGDRFERPVFHVQGGIGLFGSASADSVGFFVHPRP